MDTLSDSAVRCSGCGEAVEEKVEDFSYSVLGLEIVVPECDVRRCVCGTVAANFDPSDVEKQVAISIIEEEGRLSDIKGKFLLNYVCERLGSFPHFNSLA